MAKRIALPDGSIGEFPDSMDDTAIEGVLRKQFAPDQSDAETARLARHAPPPTDEPGQRGRDFIHGARAAFDKAALGVKGLLPQSVQDLGDRFDAARGATPLNVGTAAVAPDTLMGTAGGVAADVAMSTAPVAGGVRAASMLPRALARFAVPAADVAANAGYAAATAPEDRGDAALYGGIGSAVGRGIGRATTGIVQPTDEALSLMEKGVRLTPGQAAGKGSVMNNLEQKATSFPIAGLAVERARNRALEDANKAVAQAVVKHVDDQVKLGLPPKEAIEQVRDHIGAVYDEVLPTISAPKSLVVDFTRSALDDIAEEHHLVGAKQFKRMANYMDNRLRGIKTEDISGEMLKQIDSELGSYARTLAKSTNAEEKVAAPMWYAMQQDFRESTMRAAADLSQQPEAYQRLSSANTAYRQLLAIEKALRSSGGETIKPRPLAKALEASGIKSGELADLSKGMSATLPNTIPDTGTAGRVLLGAAVPYLAGGAYGLSTGDLTSGAVLAGALGTRVGTNALTGRGLAQRKMVELLRNRGLTRAQAEEAIKQAASQGGRTAATQE